MSASPPSRRLRATLLAALAALAVVVAACGSTTTELTDPAQILQKGAASLGEIKTVHVRGAIDGEIPLSLMGQAGAPLPIDGTTIDGDVDIAANALAVELLVPALLNFRANLVAVDGTAYLKAPLITGDQWQRQAAGGIGADAANILDGLGTFFARPELKPDKLADVRCSGTDCYSVQFTVPAAEIQGALGSLGSAIPGLSGDQLGDATVMVGVRKDNLRLATLAIDLPAGGTKLLSIALELSRYDEPVTITAPLPDQVKDAGG